MASRVAPRRLLRPLLAAHRAAPGPVLSARSGASANAPRHRRVAPRLHRLFIVMPRRDVIEILTKCRVLMPLGWRRPFDAALKFLQAIGQSNDPFIAPGSQ